MKPIHFLKRPEQTFAVKIFLVIVLLILVLSVSFTGLFIHNQWKAQNAILVRQGEVLAKLLAFNARLGVFAENPELLKDPVDGVLQNSEVLQVSIFTLTGKPLIEQRRREAIRSGRSFEPEGKNRREIIDHLRKTRSKLLTDQNDDILSFWAPVYSGSRNTSDEALFFTENLFQDRERVIGFVKVVLDKRILNASLKGFLLNLSLVALVFLVLAVLVVFFVVKGITKPLNRLTERVRLMGTGSLPEKVPVETTDEIGKLATAFNDMADSLKNREAEKEHLEQQLRQAQKMEAIGTLAGGVAHDFNNILSAIEGYAMLLRDRIKKKSSIRNYVEQIISAAERASDLTKRLLAFSRNQIINPKPINLNDTIRNIRSLLARLVGEDVEFRIHTESEELVVVADELQIEQLIINLVANARDAMPAGGVLTIATESAEISEGQRVKGEAVKPGNYAKLTVSDSGVGIDESIMEKIFDPFFTTKEVGKGTGLGLSIAYGVVKQHSGFIEVDSQVGSSTTFNVYLPVIESVVERKKLEQMLLPTGNREVVLLAEDDRFVRMLTKHILTKYGYEVIEAVDGEDAMQKFREHIEVIQLLLLDVVMPKKNGKEVYDEARRIRPDLKAVFMSGHTYDAISKQGVFSEEIPLISKPLTPGELLVKVRSVLDGNQPKPPPPSP
jgi:signal transduction histidine kinase/ActR/RegA family two-component response regulator